MSVSEFNVSELLATLADRGVELWFEGDRLRFRAPKGALTAEQRGELSARRDEVLSWLRSEAAAKHETFPLSFSQQSLWFLHQQAPNSTAYHLALSTRILGAVDVAALRHAIQATVDRHAILRTTYRIIDDAPVQHVAGHIVATLAVRNVSELSEEEFRDAIRAEFHRPFDLEHGPVLRATLFSRAPQDHVLLIALHHIAVDGRSLFLLYQELGSLYAEATGGAPAALNRPACSYADYSAWQCQTLSGAEGERLWEYWREKLAPPRTRLDLPADRPRLAQQSMPGASVSFVVRPGATEQLKEIARAEATTPFVVLLASFHTFLFRLTGAEDIIVGTPTLGRSKTEFMPVVGDFVNTVPIRAKMRAAMSFRALVADLRQTMHEALDAQELPLPLIVQRLSPERDAGRSPLFDTFFGFHRFDPSSGLVPFLPEGESPPTLDLGGLPMAAYPLPEQEVQFDLALQLLERSNDFVGRLTYRADLFDEKRIRQFVADYLSVVDAIADNPDVRLADLSASSNTESVEALLDRLREQGIRLSVEAGKLKVSAPKGAMTEAFRTTIAARRDEIVAALAAEPALGTRDGSTAIRRIPRDGRLPVSAAQRRLWFLDQIEPGTQRYNIGTAVRISGSLDTSILERAIAKVVARHEAFRSRIREQNGIPEIEIVDAPASTVNTIDLSTLPADQRLDEARSILRGHVGAPFQLEVGPLARHCLVRLTPDDHILGLSIHHIVADGWSMQLAAREIAETYDALATGRALALSNNRIDYVDYAAWEEEQLQSGRMRSQLEYWKQELKGAPALLELPTDRPRPAVLSPNGHRIRLDLDAALLEPLKQVGRRHDSTLFSVLLAALQVVLHRYSGQDDIMVGSPMANRNSPELEGIVGCFVNNLTLRGRIGGNPTFAEFLKATQQTVLGAFDHGDVPFDLIVDAVRHDRAGAQAPLFQVLLTLHSFATQLPAPAGLRLEYLQDAVDIGTSRFDLALEIAEVDAKFVVLYEYSTDLFDADTIVRMHAHFAQVLAAIAADPTTRVQDLPLLSAADQRQLLDGWNATARDHDPTRCVHGMFEAAAQRAPDAIAIVTEQASLTYRELDVRANQLAHLLIERGVTPGSLVAVCLDRTVDIPIALAAVLKAGAAYVPLDPSHPAERLRYTLDDASVACTITRTQFAPLLADSPAPLVLLDEAANELASLPDYSPSVSVSPTDRAYVIYTSGSTGRPKGVEVEHRNVVAFLEAMRREPGLIDSDVLLAVTTLSFDIAGLEFWLPLSVGARVVIASRADVLNGERIAELLEQHGVTVMQATPATWRLMCDAGWAGKRDLKVLCGGEALPRDLVSELLPRVGELWNMYGPTETTIWSTVRRIDDVNAPITIGRPIDNTRVYILEPSGLPAPIGVAGELCIGGEGVARGYHDRPELTAEKFVNLALPDGRRERVYRTGDLARYCPDGQIDFLGRRDQQVKVRGYRIELGEIEAVLATAAGVKQCVVAVREDHPGDQRIVAYIVQSDGAAFDAESAKTQLRERLPEYMLPSIFSIQSTLPLTPNGKIDRKALPAPHVVAITAVAGVPDAMMTPAERRVAAVWRDILRVDRVGLHDNFFDIGGHSLLLVRLHANLKREFETPIELVELFQWTTVAAQAKRLSASGVLNPTHNSALQRAQARAARQLR